MNILSSNLSFRKTEKLKKIAQGFLVQQYNQQRVKIVRSFFIFQYTNLMSLKIQVFGVLLVSFLTIFRVAKTQEEAAQILQLNKIIALTLEPNVYKKYSLVIPSDVEPDEILFLTAESPFNDPFQVPYMSIVSQDGEYTQYCYQQANDYSDICQIQNQILKPNRKFNIQIFCVIKCNLQIGAYFSKFIKIELSQIYTLNAMQKFGISQALEVDIPLTLQFTQIVIMTTLVNVEEVNQGFQMYANYGKNATMPDDLMYMIKADPTYGHRMSIVIGKQDIAPGDKIMLLLNLGKNMVIELTTSVLNGTIFPLVPGQPRVEVTSYKQDRLFVLDLSAKQDVITASDQINIQVIIYSGSPQIDVSFDASFPEDLTIQNYFVDRKMNFIINDKIRKQLNYNGIVYVRVSGFWSSNFYIQANINRKKFIDMESGITQMLRLAPGDLQNFIFQDQNIAIPGSTENQMIVNYKATIQMMEGSSQIGIRICHSLQDNDTLDCLITDPTKLGEQAVIQSFSQIQQQTTSQYNIYYITFNYPVNQCPNYTRQSGQIVYKCEYHIILTNSNDDNGTDDMYLALLIQKRKISNILQEGEIIRDSVDRQSSNYYSFNVVNIEQIQQLQFYVTVIQGDTALLVSKQIKYPGLDDYLEGNAQLSLFNSIIIVKDQISNGTYHVAVYGYETSDYTLNLVIRRQANTTNTNTTQNSSTQIRLLKGSTSTFSLDSSSSSSQLNFIFTPSKDEVSIVQITQITGAVRYIVKQKQKQNNQLLCNSTLFTRPDQKCKFNSTMGKTYRIEVKPQLIQNSGKNLLVFTISYSSDQSCIFYPMEIPFYVLLHNQEKQCYTFQNIPQEDLQITTSISAIQMIQSNITIKATFPAKEVNIVNHEIIFDKEQLQLLCDLQEQGQQCTFTLEFMNNKQSTSIFPLFTVVQTVSGTGTLFEGISERTMSKQISQSSPKKFYYFLDTPYQQNKNISNLMILLTSKTSTHYQVGASIVTLNEYAGDMNDDFYPKFNSQNPKHSVANSSNYSPITILSINPNKIITQFDVSKLYIVLISVFPLDSGQLDQEQIYIFQTEATQTQTQLAFGESKIGYVDKDQIYEYIITPNPETPSLVFIRHLSTDKCFKAFDVSINSQVLTYFDTVHAYTSQSNRRKILVQGTSDTSCTYQISFKALTNSISEVIIGVPYSISILQDNMTQFFIYHHIKNQSFSIIPVIDAGNVELYVNQLWDNTTVQQIIQKNLGRYQFQSQGINQVLTIDIDHKEYCVNCHYIIAVRGTPKISMQLVVNIASSPIPLKQGSFLKDKIVSGKQKHYQFYSITTFNLTVDIFYGVLHVTVIDPDGKQIFNTTVTKKQVFIVPEPQSAAGQYIDYFDDKSRFRIQISGENDAGFFVSIQKKITQLKIAEGLPVTISLQKQSPETITFQSIDSSSSLYILIENLNYFTQENPSVLTFDASVQGPLKQRQNMIKASNNVEGSFNIQLIPSEGSYFLTIVSDTKCQIEIIYAKKQFTHLVAGRSTLMKHQGIFEIFSPGTSIMLEIFVCEGGVSVTASSNFSKLLSEDDANGLIHMQHANYGGHYVVTAESMQGQYFVKITKQTSDDNLLYLASYYNFDTSKGEQIPYKTYAIADLQIQYTYSREEIQFLLSPIKRKDNQKVDQTVTYKLYIADNLDNVNNITKCGLGTAFTITERSTDDNLKTNLNRVSLTIKKSKLREIIKDKQAFFVGGQAMINFDGKQKEDISGAYFVYDVSQLLMNNEPEFPKDTKNLKFVVLWIVIPFLLGSVLLYFAARYCIKSFSQYPTQLIEEDNEVGQSEDALNANDKH